MRDSTVAVKVLDLESGSVRLEEVMREAQSMKLLHHPNVVELHASFVHEAELYMIVPYVSGGSVLNIMKYNHPDGLDETLISTIVREVLLALEYMHGNGFIHRDVKAGNILIDETGHIKVADFGVAANSLDRGSSKGSTRQTFVGTPCWMAPEVMESADGYDWHADIWSLGITILELAYGHAPFARFPPMKVLMMTLQNPAPELENSHGGRAFSKTMREFVALCLQKDPTQRPTANQLLQHRFIRSAKTSDYIKKHLLNGLPDLAERVRYLHEKREIAREARAKQAATSGRSSPAPQHSVAAAAVAAAAAATGGAAAAGGGGGGGGGASSHANKVGIDNNVVVREEKSHKEYVRGVSGWNFTMDDFNSTNETDAAQSSPRSKKEGKQQVGRFEVYKETPTGAEHREVMQQAPAAERKGRFSVRGETEPETSGQMVSSSSALQLSQEQQQQQQAVAEPAERKGRFSVQNGGGAAKQVDTTGSSSPTHAQMVSSSSASSLVGLMSSTTGMQHQQQQQHVSSSTSQSSLPALQKTASQQDQQTGMMHSSSSSASLHRRGSFDVNTAAGAAATSTSAAALIPHLQQLSTVVAEQQNHIVNLIGGLTGTVSLQDAHVLPVVSGGRKIDGVNPAAQLAGELSQRVAQLVEENERLRKRNVQLERQLNQMREAQLEEQERRNEEEEERQTNGTVGMTKR